MKYYSYIVILFLNTVIPHEVLVAKEIKDYDICDSMIKVNWLDKKYEYGYAVIESDIANKLKSKKWIMFAINEYGNHIYNLNQLHYKYGEKDLIVFLTHAKITYKRVPAVLNLDAPIFKEQLWSVYRVFGDKDDIKNSCIYSPKLKKAWVFDKRTVYGSKLEHYFSRMPGQENISSPQGSFRGQTYYDLNDDGEIDFFNDHSTRIYYSVDGEYKYIDIRNCVKFNGQPTYIYSDKSNIYVGNQNDLCNISELVN